MATEPVTGEVIPTSTPETDSGDGEKDVRDLGALAVEALKQGLSGSAGKRAFKRVEREVGKSVNAIAAIALTPEGKDKLSDSLCEIIARNIK